MLFECFALLYVLAENFNKNFKNRALKVKIVIEFLPREAMLSAVFAVVVCVCVCVCVCVSVCLCVSVCHTPVLYQNG